MTQPGTRRLSSQTKPSLTPSEINIYKEYKTLIDWTPRQIRHCSFLHKLRLAASQQPLPGILKRAGRRCMDTYKDFLKVSCEEAFVSVIWPEVPKVPHPSSLAVPVHTVRRKFRYIIIPGPIGNIPAFQEFRTDLNGKPLGASSLNGLLMVTADYASTFLYLSPADQRANRFRYFGTQKIRNRECYVVGFAQNPQNVIRAGHFYSRSGGAVLLFQGLAWIDTQTFQILRVASWLLAPQTRVGLLDQTSVVNFYAVQPEGTSKVLWVPREVKVTALYSNKGLHDMFHNTHHYSKFRLFRVESTIKP